MDMAQTYQGYFQEDGRFVADDNIFIALPIKRRVIVMVLDDEVIETKAKKQRKAFEEFNQSISQADPLGDEFDEIINQGINIPYDEESGL